MPSRKQRVRNARRRQVDRTVRVPPPPEAAQHHRPWPMLILLAAGHPVGIDAQEFEAALQIVETFRVLTVELSTKGLQIDSERVPGATHGMSDRDAERIAVWFEWSTRLPIGLPPRLVDWIEDQAPIVSVAVLRRACRLWDDTRSHRASVSRETRRQHPVNDVDTTPSSVLTMRSDSHVRLEIDARPSNLAAARFHPVSGPHSHTTLPTHSAGQIYLPAQRPGNSAHALRAAPPPTVGPRRRS